MSMTFAAILRNMLTHRGFFQSSKFRSSCVPTRVKGPPPLVGEEKKHLHWMRFGRFYLTLPEQIVYDMATRLMSRTDLGLNFPFDTAFCPPIVYRFPPNYGWK